MTVAAYTTLQISDGSVTADLVDGVNYALVDGGWAPAVAALRQSTLGGYGPYEDVEEQITLNVRGTSGAVCLANLAKLSQLLDQAERFGRGEPVNPVLLACQPQGSTLAAPLQALVIGRAGDHNLSLPETFNDLLMVYELPGVVLRFVRRGLWLGAAETGTSATLNVAEVGTCALSSTLAVPGPVKLEVAAVVPPINAAYPDHPGLLLLSDAANGIQIINADQLDDADWVLTNDAANFARGTNVARITMAAPPFYPSSAIASLATLPTGTTAIAIFAAVRNNSAAATWQMCAVSGKLAYYSGIVTPWVTIDASSQKPRLIYLGSLKADDPGLLEQIYLTASASTAVGSPTLDVNVVVVLALNPGRSGALGLILPTALPLAGLRVDAQALTKPHPQAFFLYDDGGGSDPYPMSYRGDAYFGAGGANVYATWLQPSGDYWRMASFGNLQTYAYTATRLCAYLTPK